MKISGAMLAVGGVLSFALGVFQAVICIRPAWSAAFGAPPGLVAKPPLLLASGFFMAVVFAACGIYALSGAGLVPRLPLLRLALLGIGATYLLMGAPFAPQVLALLHVSPAPVPIPFRLVAMTFTFLVMGLAYLLGLALGWKHLSRRPGAQPPLGVM